MPLSNFVARGFGFVHHSRAIFYHEVPNPNLTIRNFLIAVCAPERSPRTSGVSGVSSTPSSPSRLVSTHTEWQHQFGMMHGGSMMMPNMQPPGQGMYGVGNWQYSAEGMYGPPASPMGSSFGSLPSLQVSLC